MEAAPEEKTRVEDDMDQYTGLAPIYAHSILTIKYSGACALRVNLSIKY